MPIYEYRCEKCGHEMEAIQKMSDDPLTECPACGEATLKKLISAAGFRLKGGGWYETDFKSGKKKNLASGGDKAKSGGEKKSSGGKDSK
jgi:putative FmdB family regulatory protein